jgi:hypothetical protein
MRQLFLFIFLFTASSAFAQLMPFEKSNGNESATYFEAIDIYKKLDKASSKVWMKEVGPTDAGYPLHLVLVSADGKFDPTQWHQQKKIVIMINNGIHPGEPDGIDASLLLVRDIVTGKQTLPNNVCLAIVPVFNIGGSLNRGSFSRVNQNGPKEYGFRGNSQNLNLNRDFTKAETKNSRSFIEAFHWLDPDILIDNHVSDGADFQHTMTLITTQPDKLGGGLGEWLKSKFEPSLYQNMAEKGWEMCPYVDFVNTDISKGMTAFFDSPRYSTGFAALWQTIAFMPETHMLKPYKDRTLSTYSLMQTMIEEGSKQSADIIRLRQALKKEVASSKYFPLAWQSDSTEHNLITFKGYEKAYKTSEATGLERMYYNHAQPFTRTIPYFNTYKPTSVATAPSYYVVPQGWNAALNVLKLNKVKMRQLKSDSSILVQVYKIKDVKPGAGAFEGHHLNNNTVIDTLQQTLRFLKGDYIVPVNQTANRFIVEMLEPTGEDAFFTWNFFDAILQQKEGYSDYRWEDVAAEWLQKNPKLKEELEAKRKSDAAFATNSRLQLQWIYQHSPYYEPEHKRYPVFRIL